MPVSHLGLTVSHIPSAISFYLAALQPLGYRYIGQQGDSIGLGVADADFFLCQAQTGARVAPNHIAFAADNRLAVRNCYAAALNAGARPSGAPSYRNNDCSCFNSAIEDEDGNTIEFIFRETCESHERPAPLESGRAETCQEGTRRSGGVSGDMQSRASKVSQTKSRAQTALDVASTASKSVKKSTAPAPSITRSRTEPVTSNFNDGGKAIMGTLLGAAAGAAVAYAMVQSERDSTRDEAVFTSSARSKAPTAKDASPQTIYEGSTVSKGSQRPDSARSSRRSNGGMRAIEAPQYDDEIIQDVISRYNSSRRPELQRSATYDAIEYRPRSNAPGRSDRVSSRRAATMPIDMPRYLIEGPKTTSSRHTSRRTSTESTLKRHDSGVSMHSHHSRRRSSFDSQKYSSASKASTVKPSRRGSLYESAANLPLPPTRSQSYISAVDMPLPASRVTSYMSAAQVPVPQSRTNGGYSDVEESDGLGDTDTVVPSDSISCIDYSSKRKKSKSSSKTSHHSSKRSEAPSERTVRPAKPTGSKHSAQTLPVRSKDDCYSNRGGQRSTLTYV